jgi:hypothetical protein
MLGPISWSLTLPILLGAVQSDLPANWKPFTSKEGGFSITMPDPTTQTKKTLKTASGPLQVTVISAEGRDDALFVVSYSDYPENDLKTGTPEERLEHARKGAVNHAKGKLRSDKPLEMNGHPGREIVIEKDGNVIAKMRLYLVGRRLYQVMVLGNGPVFKGKEADSFLHSFRLIK